MSESSLIKKLAAVMKAVERIPKNGHNSFHNYDYATEADIVAAVRNELAIRNVMCVPTIVNRQREPVGEKGMVLTHLDMTFTFIDGDTGEREVCPWLGAGADKEDKGVYKAMTGGEKYFLLKTFLIPTGDDPEADDDDSDENENRQSPQQQRHSEPPIQDEPPHPAEASRQNRDGDRGVLVLEAKIAKRGQSARGPWTLYAVRFDNGKEGTTFSQTLYDMARDAHDRGVEVNPIIVGKNLEGLEVVSHDDAR